MYNFNGAKGYAKDVTFDVFKRTWRPVYQVGPVLVYQEVTFTLGAALSATATAAIEATANSKISRQVTFGVQYNPVTGAWEAVAPTVTRDDSITADLSVKGGVYSEIRLIPNVEVKFYKIVAGNLSLEPVLSGNIESTAVANADFLAGYFPPGTTQLTAFDAALTAQCFVGANLHFISKTIPLLDKRQVCAIPVAAFFSLPKLKLASQRQTNGSYLLTANIVDGINNPFNDASIKWTVYPANAGAITGGQSRQAIFTRSPAVNANSITIFFSGYGKLGELGRQFVQTLIPCLKNAAVFCSYNVTEIVTQVSRDAPIKLPGAGLNCNGRDDPDIPFPVGDIPLLYNVGDITNSMHLWKLDGVNGTATVDAGVDGQVVGTYNGFTGAITISEVFPRRVGLITPTTQFYSEGSYVFAGSYDPATNQITGNEIETSTISWSLSAATVTCVTTRSYVAVP